MSIDHSTKGVLEVTPLDVPQSVISLIPSQEQQFKETNRVALEQINNLKQQIRALEAKNLALESNLAGAEKTEERLRNGFQREIKNLIKGHDEVKKSYIADIDRLTNENQFWKNSSLKVGTHLTNMPIQISNLRRDHDVVIESCRADIDRLTADIDRLTNENQFWKNSFFKVGTEATIMLKENTRHKEELATYKKVSIGFVVVCSLYPLGSKFCTTETARMIANGAVQLCSALKRGLTGARADQLV